MAHTGWIIPNYFIMCYIDTKYHRMCMLFVISDLILTRLDLLFVDDYDLPTTTNKLEKTFDNVMACHQDEELLYDGYIWVIA